MMDKRSADKSPRRTEIVKRLREGIAAQSCQMCKDDSATYVRCGRGSCAWERLLMEEAADLLDGIHPDEAARPSQRQKDLAEQILWDALDSIRHWKRNALDYDKDMGHEERTFCEDVDLIEGMAERHLSMYDDAAAARSPQAPTGEFDALAKAVKEYDEAIHSCGNDPEKMASFCSAQGDDLDSLYFAMVNLANRAGQPFAVSHSEETNTPKAGATTATSFEGLKRASSQANPAEGSPLGPVSILRNADGSPIFWQPRADECQQGCKRHDQGQQPCSGECFFLRSSTAAPGPDGEKWHYDAANSCFFSDDFTHDAALKLSGDFSDEYDKAAYAAKLLKRLATPLSATGLKDTERLDFIERMGRNANWVARHSSTGRGYRLHNSKDGTALSARAAIDEAMSASRDGRAEG